MNAAGTVRDPICGMVVDPKDAAAVAERGGETFYFCSEHCRQKFVGGETTPSSVVGQKLARKYFCPMCDGVESDMLGSCPKCGMVLERNPTFREPGKII